MAFQDKPVWKGERGKRCLWKAGIGDDYISEFSQEVKAILAVYGICSQFGIIMQARHAGDTFYTK